MHYLIKDDVPESWDFIIDAFRERVIHDIKLNRMPLVQDLEFGTRHGLLHVNYGGGDKVTDAYAALATTMSEKICSGCGALASRVVFESPKCEDCY